MRASPMLARWLHSSTELMNRSPGLAPARDAEREHRAGALGQVARGALVVGVPGQAGVAHPRDPGVGVEPLRDLTGVGRVLAHPLRQRLHALEQEERRVRR